MKPDTFSLPFFEPSPEEAKRPPVRILLIINPVSGRMKTRTGLFEILDELYRKDAEPKAAVSEPNPAPMVLPIPFGGVTSAVLGGEPAPDRRVTVVPTLYRGHASELAASAHREGFDTVICCGGDGTLNETVSGLLAIPEGDRPALGYVPAGSTNDFAASIGLPSSLRGAARNAVGVDAIPIDVGEFRCRGMDRADARFFTYIASFGVFTAASYSTSQTAKNLFGHVAYLVEGLRDLAKVRPIHADFVLADGTAITGDFVFCAVTNTTSAGGVVKLPADRVSLSDGRFELLLIRHPRSAADLQRIANALLLQDFDSSPLVELLHTEGVTVTTDTPLSWSLDGEEAEGSREVCVRCLPSAIRLKLQGDRV